MRRLAALIGTLLLSSSVSATSFYGVGNSLLADSYVHINGVASFAASRGHSHAGGYHIVGGASLGNIWQQSVDNTWNTYGVSPSRFDSALTQHWDQVVLEPFYDSTSSEKSAATKFINLSQTNPANASTRYLLFASWTGTDPIGVGTYSDVWNAPYSGGENQQARSAAYFQTVLDSLRAEKPGLAIDVIPVGHVFALLDSRARAGEIPGLADISQAYRDNLHAGRVGMYVSALTYYATLYKEDPRGLGIHGDYTLALPTQSTVVTPVLAGAIQQAVYDVVFGNPQMTGVPEPMSLALFAGAGMLARRRRS